MILIFTFSFYPFNIAAFLLLFSTVKFAQISKVVLNSAQLNPWASSLMRAVLMNFKLVENCDTDTF